MAARSPEDTFTRYLARPSSRRRFAAVVDAFRDVVYRAALRISGNESDASDIAQDVFVQLLLRPPEPGSVERPAGYLLFRVLTLMERAKRTAERRRAREQIAAERLLAQGGSVEIDSEALLQAVEALPERQRRAVELTYLLECPRSDVASALGVSERTAAYDLAAALEALRGRLVKVALVGALSVGAGRAHGATGGLPVLPDLASVVAPPSFVQDLDRIVRLGDILGAPAAAGVSTTLLGGLIMSKSVTALTLTVVLVTAGIWFARRDAQSPPVVDESAPAAIAGRVPDELSRPAAAEPQAAPAAEKAPTRPRVDFDALDEDLDVAGFVRAQNGAPIAGAIVSARDEAIARVSDLTLDDPLAPPPATSTLTADDGSFALRLERGEETHVRASAPGYGTAFAPNVVAGKRVEITLAPEARLEVRLVDESDKPVDEAQVRIWRRSELDTYDHRKLQSDASGLATFEALPPGKVYLAISHDRLGSPGWEFPVLEAGKTTQLELVLRAGRTIHGRVVDAESGQPIPHARVGAGWTLARKKQSDADGRYEFPGWTGEGEDTLVATARGYGRATASVQASDQIDFELTPAYAVHGRVLDDAGTGLVGIRVSAVASQMRGKEQQTDSDATRTDAQGGFALVNLNRKWPYTLVFQSPGYGRFLLDVDASLAVEGRIDLGDLELPRGRSIEGVVVGASGEGVGDAVVRLEGHNQSRGALREGKPLAVEEFYAGVETRRADDLGRFRFPDLAPGQYTLGVKLEGRSPIVETVELLESDLRDLRLVARGTYTTIAHVVDDAGSPVRGVEILLKWPRRREVLRAHTDGAGRAELVHSSVNNGAVLGFDPPRGYVRRDARRQLAGERELQIVIRRSAVLSGTLVGEAGAPIAHQPIDVVVRETGETRGSAFSDGDGRFRYDAEAGEVVDLRVSDFHLRPGGVVVHSTVRGELRGITAPAEDLKLVAVPRSLDGVLSFRVLDPAGTPGNGVVLLLEGGQGKTDDTPPKTDADGRVRFEGLPLEELKLGALQLTIEGPEGYVLWCEPRRVTPGVEGSPEIVLALERCFAVSGQVHTTTGEPASRSVVVARRTGGQAGAEVARVTTGEAGFFLFRLPDGARYTIEASLGDASARAEVDAPSRLRLSLGETR